MIRSGQDGLFGKGDSHGLWRLLPIAFAISIGFGVTAQAKGHRLKPITPKIASLFETTGYGHADNRIKRALLATSERQNQLRNLRPLVEKMIENDQNAQSNPVRGAEIGVELTRWFQSPQRTLLETEAFQALALMTEFCPDRIDQLSYLFSPSAHHSALQLLRWVFVETQGAAMQSVLLQKILDFRKAWWTYRGKSSSGTEAFDKTLKALRDGLPTDAMATRAIVDAIDYDKRLNDVSELQLELSALRQDSLEIIQRELKSFPDLVAVGRIPKEMNETNEKFSQLEEVIRDLDAEQIRLFRAISHYSASSNGRKWFEENILNNSPGHPINILAFVFKGAAERGFDSARLQTGLLALFDLAMTFEVRESMTNITDVLNSAAPVTFGLSGEIKEIRLPLGNGVPPAMRGKGQIEFEDQSHIPVAFDPSPN